MSLCGERGLGPLVAVGEAGKVVAGSRGWVVAAGGGREGRGGPAGVAVVEQILLLVVAVEPVLAAVVRIQAVERAELGQSAMRE